MAVAVVPIPPGTPDRSTVRLRRLSGRPVPMFEDAGKTVGPIYATLLDVDAALYADVGLYELQIRTPGGVVTVTQVQVGVGQTPPNDPDIVTPEELELILADERALAQSLYAATAGAETITGTWTFQTEPLRADGSLLSSGGTGGLSEADKAALTAEYDARYFRPTQPTTISGVVDFTTAPTINGETITAGSDAALYSQVEAAVAAARAAQTAAEAAQAAAEALAQQGAVSFQARVARVRLEVVNTTSTADPVDRFEFPGSPGQGNMRLGANHGHNTIGSFDLALYPPASGSTPTARCSTVREYSQDPLDLDAGMRANMRTWCTEGRVPMVSMKCSLGADSSTGLPTDATKLAELQAIVDGSRDAQLERVFEFLLTLTGPRGGAVWFSPLWHEPEDDYRTAEQLVAFRRATRRIITRGNAAGLSGRVAWAGVHYIGSTFFPRSGVDWKQYHANWGDSGGWQHDLLKLDAVDRYNPAVQPTSTARNRTWSQDAAYFLDRRRTDGAIELPWIIGEHGLYSDNGNPYDDNGVTVQSILTDMVNIGAATQGLVGCAMWNNARASIGVNAATTDPGGVRKAALQSAGSLARVIKLPAA